MSIFDDQPDIDPLSPEAMGIPGTRIADHDELMRRAAQISIRWSRALELLEKAEHEEQRQAEEAAVAHMDSPWPHRPAS